MFIDQADQIGGGLRNAPKIENRVQMLFLGDYRHHEVAAASIIVRFWIGLSKREVFCNASTAFFSVVAANHWRNRERTTPSVAGFYKLLLNGFVGLSFSFCSSVKSVLRDRINKRRTFYFGLFCMDFLLNG